jgi:MinD superfamily P-loop ATPase
MEAQQVAAQQHKSLIIVDGPPGVGCPVIASVTGASLVLVVTEPTVSGEHDLDRVLQLANHFKIPAAVCVNKWDVNPTMADQIEHRAAELGAGIAGRVRYDEEVTASQVKARAATELGGDAADDIRGVWNRVLEIGEKCGIGS